MFPQNSLHKIITLWILLTLLVGIPAIELKGQEISDEKDLLMKRFQMSCNDRCAVESDEMDEDRSCHCDDSCPIYGDCCADTEEMNVTTVKLWSSRVECLDVTPDQNGVNVYFMITRCPLDWKDDIIRTLCEQSDDNHDPLMATPVTNKQSNLTFRNSYCAICNGQHNPLAVQLWIQHVSCPDVPEDTKISLFNNSLSWDENIKRWTVDVLEDGNRKRFPCSIWYQPEDLQRLLRPCISYAQVSCPQDSKLQTLCQTYQAPVEIDEKTYKNIHCAMCDGVVTDNTESQDGENPTVECGGMSGANQKTMGSTFSVLFDFRSINGSDKVGSVCNAGELFDPFLKQCRAVFCPEKKILKQGKCVVKPQQAQIGAFPQKMVDTTTTKDPTPSLAKESISENSSTESALGKFSSTPTSIKDFLEIESRSENETCAQIRLESSEYEIRNNFTIYMYRSQKLLGPDEYEIMNGSIFVCADDLTEGERFDKYLRGFSLFFLGLSEICLLIHMTFGCLTDDFTNLSGKSIQSLSFSLFIGFGLFLIMQYVEGYTLGCTIIGILAHYFFLSAFWWSSVMAFDVFRTLHLATTQLRCPDKQRQRFILYSLWAWLTPAVLVTTAVIIDYMDTEYTIPSKFHPHYGRGICWIGEKVALLIYFVLPLAVILALNFVLFFWTLYVINSNSLRRVESKKEAVLFIRLAVLMGLSWVTGIIAGAADVTFLWYIFVILCASQGIFILIVFTLNAKTVRTWYSHRVGTSDRDSRNTTSSLWTTAQGTFQPSYYSVNKQISLSCRPSRELQPQSALLKR